MPGGMWGGRRARGDEVAQNRSLDDIIPMLFAEWDARTSKVPTNVGPNVGQNFESL